MPAGKRLAPMLGELLAVLRQFGELVIDEDTAALLVSMSAATIDRRLASERAKYQLKGRCTTKPGSLLKSQIPVRTWADWDDARPGFVEIDLVSHDGGNPAGTFAFTLTVTDIATGWTENRSVPSKAAPCVLRALNDIAYRMPFPILGVDSDNGSEFINIHLLRWCERHQITFTRARPGNKNDGCHVEQKNWAVVRTVVRYHRYDTAPELLLLNEIWQLQSKLTNYFYPQQKLVSKVRHGAKVAKKHDTAATPFHRAIDHPAMTVERIVALTQPHSLINPAATQRQIQTLTAQLLTITTNKAGATAKAQVNKRARSHEATNPPSRASGNRRRHPTVRTSGPMPPPVRNPTTPTLGDDPHSGASPYGVAASSTCCQVAPAPIRATRASGSTSQSVISPVCSRTLSGPTGSAP